MSNPSGSPQTGTEQEIVDDLFADFARGALDPGTELLVETCAALKSDVAGSINDYEAVGGTLLESIEPAPLKPGALEAVLSMVGEEDDASVDEPGPDARVSAGTAKWRKDLDMLPLSLRRHAEEGLARSRWKFRGRGIRSLDLTFLDPDRSGSIELYRIEPGCAVPRHGHEGDELTLVVTGAFQDEQGRYGPGDIAAGSEDITHKPVAEPGEVCLALAVTNAPLKMKGALGLVQRIISGSKS